MKTVKLKVLVTAAVLSWPCLAQADVLSDENALSEGFIGGSAWDLKLRQAYFRRDYKRGVHNSDTWGQGIELNYHSGYLNHILGFEASYYGGFPLSGDVAYGHNPGLLPSDSHNHLDNYSKLGQAFLKAKYGDEHLGVYGQAGRMEIDNVLVTSSTSRLTPSTFQGGLADFYVQGVKLQYLYLNQESMRNQSGFDHFQGKNGTIDHVQGVAAWYDFNPDTHFGAEYTDSDQYLTMSYYNLNHKLVLDDKTNLVFDGQYYRADGSGQHWSGEDRNGHGYQADIYSLSAILTREAWTLSAGYTYSDIEGNANGSDGGVFYYQLSDQDAGGGALRTMAGVSDFAYDGENAYVAGVQYDFSQYHAPGLKAGVNAFYGNNIRYAGQTGGTEQEYDYFFTYEFQQKPLNGLSLTWDYYDYRAGNRNIDYYAKGGILHENRLYLDYSVPLS